MPNLRTYPTKWPNILLACRKCQKKLKHSDLGKLKKLLKSQARAQQTEPAHLIQVSCLKLCPKGGVTVCTQANLAQTPPQLTILYTPQDLAALKVRPTVQGSPEDEDLAQAPVTKRRP